jgi:hypothetical protein
MGWLLPEPVKPRVVPVGAPAGFAPPPGARVTPFTDNAALTAWLALCPAPEGAGAGLSSALCKRAAGRAPILRKMAPLAAGLVVHDSWPDLTDAVDLHALSNGRPDARSLLLAVVDVRKAATVRACHGVAGLNTAARMWVSDREVEHGAIVRLGKGLHPVVIEARHGHDGAWIKWKLARLATRFTAVTLKEVAELHAWQLREWRFTRDSASLDEAALLRRIRIDPKTMRGREGFFRVGRSVNGRWWMIDPDGKPFHHRGSTGLNAGGTGGRRAGLPPVDGRTVRKWTGLLRKWGFNAMGAWSTPEFFGNGMPYTETIEGYYVEPWLDMKFPDVFDPLWARNLDAKCRPICEAVKDSRMMIGYFLDNERGFMEFPGRAQTVTARSPTYRRDGPLPVHGLELAAEPKLNISGIGLLQYCLSQKEGVPAGERAWEFVLARHGTMQGVGRAWGITLGTRTDVRLLAAREEILISKAYLRDLRDFVALWVEQYYKVFTQTIRRHDPNHLILGMRHGGIPGPVTLAVESRWTDVISQNSYRAEFMEGFDVTYQASHTPILDGEFNTYTDSYSVARNPIEPPGGYDAHTRWQIRGQAALDNVARHPGIVGYTMYRWNGSGNDDKLWNLKGNRPNKPVVAELQRINCRSLPIAARSDAASASRHPPLHGQVFLCLQGGARHRDQLPPATEGLKPGTIVSGAPLHLGLVCRRGRWDNVVYGNGIRGEVLRQKSSNGRYALSVRIRSVNGLLTREAAAEYELEFGHDGEILRGTHSGRYNGIRAKGAVVGYLFRPVPTVNL